MPLRTTRISTVLSYWLPPLLWCLVILVLSGETGSAGRSLAILKWLFAWIPGITPAHLLLLHGYLRKLAHVTVYGVLYFFWFRAVRGHLQKSSRRAFLWGLLVCLAVAFLDEGHQYRLNSRTGSILDVALDLGGAVLAAGVTALSWRPRLKPVSTPKQVSF